MNPIRLGALFLVFLLFLGGVALMIPDISPGQHVWPLSMFAVGLVILLGVLVAGSASSAKAHRRQAEDRSERGRAHSIRR